MSGVGTVRSWFHGGVPGLQVGDRILPPDQTGTDHTLSGYAPPGASHGGRTDVVYVTSRQDSARVFAAIYPDGALYRVGPAGWRGLDPDAPHEAMMCDSALVVEVVYARIVFAHRSFESWVSMLQGGGSRG